MPTETLSARGWSFTVIARDDMGLPSIVADARTGEEYESPYQGEDEWRAVVFDSTCEAVDGCTVEPDGISPDGYPSWLIVAGLI